MKMISILTLVLMLVMTVACGGKDKGSSSSSSSFSNALSTQNGYYNTQTHAIEVGGQTYPPSQQYAAVMNQALQQAQMANIQPVNVNGVMKFRAKITAQAINNNTGAYNNTNPYNNNPYNNNPYNTQYGASQLNIASVQFY